MVYFWQTACYLNIAILELDKTYLLVSEKANFKLASQVDFPCLTFSEVQLVGMEYKLSPLDTWPIINAL